MSRLSFVLATALGSLALGAGCTKPNPASCADHFCDDPSLPFCDSDGALEGTPNACIAVDCTANDFVQCRGDDAILCNDTGDNYLVAPCGALGCDDASGCITETHSCTPGTVQCGNRVVESCNADGVFETEACDVSCIDAPAPHCSYLSPKYLPDICDTPATAAHLDFGPFNTDIDSQCNGGIVTQVDGPDICVVRYGTITVPAGIEAKVTGRRALALVADGMMTIAGTIDISADGVTSGPGGGFVQSGTSSDAGGGGGGGFASAGAAGGTPTVTGGGVPGTSAAARPVEVLSGGSGQSLPPLMVITQPHAAGGGGGGALAAIACRGRVELSGSVDAGGGGGVPGRSQIQQPHYVYAAGGGGAGGYIVLQGLAVAVTGTVFANGGSGGNGCAGAGSADGIGGVDALRSVAPAKAPVGAGQPHGGDGGAKDSGPTPGAAVTDPAVGATGAGGGGSVGILQTFTPNDVIPALNAVDLSPRFDPNGHVDVR